MKSGDIVWAKIREEPSGTCYWPGLLQTRDTLGVLVSFFNLQTPRHFHDSEIHPFSGNFLQSAPTNLDDACNALLDRALRWLCRRTALSLRCRCLSETAVAKMSGGLEMAVGDGEAFQAKNSFRPEAVLGFVLSKAVLPWVEVEGFVGAVRSVAEIQVFRDYNAIGQKSVYQKSRRAWWRYERGTHLELQSHPSSGSMAEESCNLEWNFDGQASPKPKEANMEAGAASRMNSTVVFSKESFRPLHEDQLEKQLIQVQKEEGQSSSEILVNLRCLALDSFCLGVSCLNNTQQRLLGFRSILFENVSVRHIKKCSSKSRETYLSSPGYLKTQPSVEASEILVNLRCLALDSFCLGVSCLNNTQQHLLGFRSILFEKVSDRHIKKCSPSKSREAYLSSPGYLKTQPSVEADEKKCDDGVCGSNIPYIERPVSRLGFKRQLDLPAFCESPYKLNKRTPSLLINGAGYCLQMNRPPEAGVERSGMGSEETSIHNFSFCSSKMLEIQNSRALILNHASKTGLLEFSPNTSDFSLLKDSARLSNIIDISKDEEHKVKDACGSYVELQELDRSISIVKRDRSCMYNICNTSEKTINGFANEDMKVDNSFGLLQPSATQLSISEMLGTNASDVEKANHDAATKVSRSEFRPILDSTQMQTSGDKDAISGGPNKRAVSLNVASEEKIEKTKKFDSSCPSGLLFNSHEAEQSKALPRFDGSKSLHMKFPRDYNLPSKEKLIRKFRRFGPIDSLKTKIFDYTGFAQVVFLNESDAMAAYQYAKDAISVGPNKRAVSLNVASEEKIEKTKKFHSYCPSGLLFNSHGAEQSKALPRFDGSKSLHMKFPRDYNLPSKEKLIRKFRRFGPIDSLKTKIFYYTGSAQVVFRNQSDAMAAYQYAKGKKLLPGQPNVRYWLDPFESKRGAAKYMTGKQLGPELKSCLRSSEAPGAEDKRKHKKVRFLMTGKPLGPELKSCLRNSDAPGAEDKRRQKET